MDFLLDFRVNVQPLLGSGNIISEVIVVEILPHVLQSVQEVAGLPEVVLQGLKYQQSQWSAATIRHVLVCVLTWWEGIYIAESPSTLRIM